MKIIVNCETSEITQRELNAEELEQQAVDEAIVAAQQAEVAAKAAARAEILDRLGLNEEEAKLLLS
jgi:hypothetical protein